MCCNVPTLLAAQELGLQVNGSFMRSAAAAGRLDVVKLLHTDQGVPLPAFTGYCAAANDRIEVLRWLRDVDPDFNESTANGAAEGGHAAILVWLLKEACPVNPFQLCTTAARYGHMCILTLLQERGLLPAQSVLSRVLNVAGAFDQRAVAQWLRQRGAEWLAVLCHGNRSWCGATLDWARAEGCTAPTGLIW
jgi:hypothetical protein